MTYLVACKSSISSAHKCCQKMSRQMTLQKKSLSETKAKRLEMYTKTNTESEHRKHRLKTFFSSKNVLF